MEIRLRRLTAEVFNKSGKRTRIAIGQIIYPEQLAEYPDTGLLGEFFRNKVYNQH